MSEAVDKLMAELRSACAKEQVVRSHHVIYAQEAIAFLRAELEQVNRDNANLKDMLVDARNGAAKLLADRIRAEAAERLAGARVKVEPLAWGDIDGDIVARTEIKTYRCSKFGDGWDLLIDGVHTKPYRHGVRETYSLEAAKAAAQADYERRILSALAEPAGEVEPRQFLATEDGEFNGNTETPIAAEDEREVDWVDVTGWGVFKGHAIPVDVARYIATKVNLYAEHRTAPPDASAIRGAQVEAVVQAVRPYTRETLLIDEHRDLVRAALAGAKP